MRKVVFECREVGKECEKEFEFNDDVTAEEIQKKLIIWVWSKIGNNYGWHEE